MPIPGRGCRVGGLGQAGGSHGPTSLLSEKIWTGVLQMDPWPVRTMAGTRLSVEASDFLLMTDRVLHLPFT